jgi:hypothetical protein
MTVREPSRLRKALLAGVVALVLTGAGTAIAWSATDSPTSTPAPSPSGSSPGKSDQAPDEKKPAKSQRPQVLHSESAVKKADGTFETRLTQQGTVDSVSSTSVTVKSEDGFIQSYAVTTETKITKFPAPAADGSPAKGDDGKRLKPAAGTIADIAAGDAVQISGVKSGDRATAARIVEGAGTGPGKGKGLGKGLGQGHGHGKGHGHAKQLPPTK